jgi:hypothetical protein
MGAVFNSTCDLKLSSLISNIFFAPAPAKFEFPTLPTGIPTSILNQQGSLFMPKPHNCYGLKKIEYNLLK